MTQRNKVNRSGLSWLHCEREVVERLTKLGYFPSEIVPYLPTIRTPGAVKNFIWMHCNPGRKPGAYGASRRTLPEIRYGFDHSRSQLNKHLARRILRKSRIDGQSLRSIAKDLGISYSVVRDFLNGRTYKEVDRDSLR